MFFKTQLVLLLTTFNYVGLFLVGLFKGKGLWGATNFFRTFMGKFILQLCQGVSPGIVKKIPIFSKQQ